MLSNYKTTIAGSLLGVGYYSQMNGLNLPSDAGGWLAFAISALLAILGILAKDSNTRP